MGKTWRGGLARVAGIDGYWSLARPCDFRYPACFRPIRLPCVCGAIGLAWGAFVRPRKPSLFRNRFLKPTRL